MLCDSGSRSNEPRPLCWFGGAAELYVISDVIRQWKHSEESNSWILGWGRKENDVGHCGLVLEFQLRDEHALPSAYGQSGVPNEVMIVTAANMLCIYEDDAG